MPWSATSRYGLDPAPGALGLAQDLLGADGSVRLQPQETGPRALVMLVLAALLEGRQVDQP
jgi:hypothetical protein